MENQLLNQFLQANLGVVRSLITERIQLEYAKQAALNVLAKLEETITVITDDNTDNKAQLQLIWGHILADAGISDSIRLALLDASAKVQNENVKEALTLVVEPLVQTLVAINDDELNNSTQLESIWTKFLKSPEFILVVEKNLEAVLSKVIENKTVVTLLVALLTTVLRNR